MSSNQIAETAHTYVTGPLENGLLKIGINNPWKAGLFFAGISAVGLYYLKPSISFDEQGRVRPWVFMYNPEAGKEGAPEPTYCHFLFSSLAIGYMVSLVI